MGKAERPGTPAGTANELSGTVHGPVVQAGTIHGDVHIYPPPPATLPLPGQLPPPGPPLAGRDADLQAMDTAAQAGRVILVTGLAGTGKTALTLSWAHGMRDRFPDGTLFADLLGYAPGGPTSAGEVLGRFLRALGVDTRRVPADPAELTSLYRSAMAGKRVLVVLDDARSGEQVLPLLPPGPASTAVVTSRLRLGSLVPHGARFVPVGPLDPGAGLDLLSRIVNGGRAGAEPDAARDLVKLCGGHPLALCVAGARLAVRPAWRVSEMTALMRLNRERLAALATEDDTAVTAALDLSYEALPGEAAHMYRLAGLFPGIWFDSRAAAAAAEVPHAEARRLLGLLADANLLEDPGGNQYQFHDLTRLHAFEKAQDEPAAVRDEAVGRMLDWYLAAAVSARHAVTRYYADADQAPGIRYPPADPARFGSDSQALDWLDGELPNMLAVAREADSHRQFTAVWQLADAMWPLFLYRGRHAERLELDRLGLQAARTAGDALGEATMLYRLGTALKNDGRFDQAEACTGQAMDAWQRLGRPDRVAGCLRRLGSIAMARRRPDQAAELFTRALAGYRKYGDSRHIAVTLSNLSETLTVTGNPAGAIAALDEARTLLEGYPDPHSRARALTRLGLAYDRAGDPGTAYAHLGAALNITRQIGSASAEADVLTALGDLARRTGREDEAQARYDEADQVRARLRSPLRMSD